MPIMNAMGKRAILIACILVCPLFAGCPLAPESNEAACKRAMTHMFNCGMEETGESEELGPEQIDALVTLVCADTPEASECPWPAYANCITALSCDELVTLEPGSELCGDLMAELEDNACLQSGFCGPVGPSMVLLPIALVGLRFARRGWVC